MSDEPYKYNQQAHDLKLSAYNQPSTFQEHSDIIKLRDIPNAFMTAITNEIEKLKFELWCVPVPMKTISIQQSFLNECGEEQQFEEDIDVIDPNYHTYDNKPMSNKSNLIPTPLLTRPRQKTKQSKIIYKEEECIEEEFYEEEGLEHMIDQHTLITLTQDRNRMSSIFDKLKMVSHLINNYIIWFLMRMMFLQFEGDEIQDYHDLTLPDGQQGRQLFLKHFRYTYDVLKIFDLMASHHVEFPFEEIQDICLWIFDQPYFKKRPEILLVCRSVLNRMPIQTLDDKFEEFYKLVASMLREEWYQQPEVDYNALEANIVAFQHDYPWELMTFNNFKYLKHFSPISMLLQQLVYCCSKEHAGSRYDNDGKVIYYKVGGMPWVIDVFLPDLVLFSTYSLRIKKRMIDCLNEIIEMYEKDPRMLKILTDRNYELTLALLSKFIMIDDLLDSQLKFLHLGCVIAGNGNDTTFFQTLLEAKVFHNMIDLFLTGGLDTRHLISIGKVAQTLAGIADPGNVYFDLIAVGDFVHYLTGDIQFVFTEFLMRLLGRGSSPKNTTQYLQRLLFVLSGFTKLTGEQLTIEMIDKKNGDLLKECIEKEVHRNMKNVIEVLYNIKEVCIQNPEIQQVMDEVRLYELYDKIDDTQLDDVWLEMFNQLCEWVYKELPE